MTGMVTTLAGSGNAAHADGQGAEAMINGPSGVAVDSLGNLYAAEFFGFWIRIMWSAGKFIWVQQTSTVVVHSVYTNFHLDCALLIGSFVHIIFY